MNETNQNSSKIVIWDIKFETCLKNSKKKNVLGLFSKNRFYLNFTKNNLILMLNFEIIFQLEARTTKIFICIYQLNFNLSL